MDSSACMNRNEIVNDYAPDCPVRNVLARIGDKWSILVLLTLNQDKPVRFNELMKSIPDISQKMLTTTLRTLEDDGYLKRKVYPEVPPKVEYRLTDRALSLLPHINSLICWANENLSGIIKDRRRNVRRHGTA